MSVSCRNVKRDNVVTKSTEIRKQFNRQRTNRGNERPKIGQKIVDNRFEIETRWRRRNIFRRRRLVKTDLQVRPLFDRYDPCQLRYPNCLALSVLRRQTEQLMMVITNSWQTCNESFSRSNLSLQSTFLCHFSDDW